MRPLILLTTPVIVILLLNVDTSTTYAKQEQKHSLRNIRINSFSRQQQGREKNNLQRNLIYKNKSSEIEKIEVQQQIQKQQQQFNQEQDSTNNINFQQEKLLNRNGRLINSNGKFITTQQNRIQERILYVAFTDSDTNTYATHITVMNATISNTTTTNSTRNSTCLSTQYYQSSNSTCVPCSSIHTNCIRCNSSQCLQCQAGSSDSDNPCVVPSCQSNQFVFPGTTTCYYCYQLISNCATCNYTNCHTCSKGSLNPYTGNCSVCSSSQYTESGSCFQCASRFNNCAGCNSTNCLRCISGDLDSDNGPCTTNSGAILNCTSSQFQSNSTCQECSTYHSNCQTCNQTQCTQCSGSFTAAVVSGCEAVTNPSGPNCSLNYYFDSNRQSCSPCQSHCSICISNVQCILCQQQYALSLSRCIKIPSNSQIAQMMGNINDILNSTMISPVSQTIIKYPVARRLLYFAFQFFPNIDDLWFFAYHDVQYSFTLSTIFNGIRELESNKFNPFSSAQAVTDWLSSIEQMYDHYKPYGKQKFILIQGKSSGFHANIIQFLFLTVPQNIFLFMILRFLFKILFKYEISKFLRQFSFNGFFLLTLLDGNVQYFFYISANQIQNLFNFSFFDKFSNFTFVLIFFFIVQGSVSLFFLLKYFYNNLASYFLDNAKQTNAGIAYIVLYFGLRNIAISIINSFASKDYQTKIIILITCDILFLIAFIGSLIKWKCFRSYFKFWISILFPMLRLTLQVTFYIFYNQSQSISQLGQKIHGFIFLSYLLLWIVSILVFVLYIVIQAIQNFVNKESLQTQNQQFQQTIVQKQPNIFIYHNKNPKHKYNLNKFKNNKIKIKSTLRQKVQFQVNDECLSNINSKQVNKNCQQHLQQNQLNQQQVNNKQSKFFSMNQAPKSLKFYQNLIPKFKEIKKEKGSELKTGLKIKSFQQKQQKL